MDEIKAVTAANAAFYRAFETLDIQEMEKVWLRAGHIKCVHPGWPLL
ncbi:MAG: nuclear transport factor 2 family protein, partial [Candidatus Binatia bacterium]